MLTDEYKNSSDMKSKQIEILEKVAKGELTVEQADKELLVLYIVSKRPCGIKDRNGKDIHFGDTLRFADKVEWYRGSYWAKVAVGTMTREQAIKEIDEQPYEERLIENEQDYEWLLSSEIQTYWEVVC